MAFLKFAVMTNKDGQGKNGVDARGDGSRGPTEEATAPILNLCLVLLYSLLELELELSSVDIPDKIDVDEVSIQRMRLLMLGQVRGDERW